MGTKSSVWPLLGSSIVAPEAQLPKPGLRAVGTTDDGVIEALDAEFEHPFFYAVQ